MLYQLMMACGFVYHPVLAPHFGHLMRNSLLVFLCISGVLPHFGHAAMFLSFLVCIVFDASFCCLCLLFVGGVGGGEVSASGMSEGDNPKIAAIVPTTGCDTCSPCTACSSTLRT